MAIIRQPLSALWQRACCQSTIYNNDASRRIRRSIRRKRRYRRCDFFRCADSAKRGSDKRGDQKVSDARSAAQLGQKRRGHGARAHCIDSDVCPKLTPTRPSLSDPRPRACRLQVRRAAYTFHSCGDAGTETSRRAAHRCDFFEQPSHFSTADAPDREAQLF